MIEPTNRKNWSHVDVEPDGKVKDGGGVVTEAGMEVFRGTPCSCNTCNGAHDFLVICKGYNKKEKTVSGYTLFFNNEDDMDKYIEEMAGLYLQVNG